MSDQRHVTDPFDERYQRTIFLLDSSMPVHWRFFCVITACNPAGQLSSSGANDESTKTLRRCLLTRELPFYHVVGSSSDMTHQEMGFGVQMGIKGAKEFAQMFQQLAFYFIEDDQLFLVDSSTLETKFIGSWSARVIVR
ncbi:MAG: DUF3293 domain-containing protein [Bradymonadia bacterium]